MNDAGFTPAWDAPPRVRALTTTRAGGVSTGPYTGFNLAQHVGDDPAAVTANRELLRQAPYHLPADPLWLRQVHGTQVLAAENYRAGVEADACVSRTPGLVCAVMTADCLPLLLCAADASVVAAVHAGWRGLAAGVIEASVSAMAVAPARLHAWLGPAIGPAAFEVGADVLSAFRSHDTAAIQAFVPRGRDKWRCDLYLLARQRLARLGVRRVTGGEWCTYNDAKRFYSYRRDGVTGRMASCIWLEA